MRLSYQESFDRAAKSEALQGIAKPDIAARPRHDDDTPGPYYFKTLLENGDLTGLTLPGLFIGRSEIRKTRFSGSDLHLSTLCWNDFEQCDFAGADLSQSDLRASNFKGCSFKDAVLDGCDLRHATFEACDFAGAGLKGALLTRGQQKKLTLAKEQVDAIDWQILGGAFPEGG